MTDLADPLPDQTHLEQWVAAQDKFQATSGKYKEVKELEDGYAFGYPAGEKWEEQVAQMAQHLRDRLGVQADVDVEPGGLVWLRVTGGADVKAWLRRGLDYAEGKVKGTGTQYRTKLEKLTKMGIRYVTNHVRVLPDFLIIGAAKAGTTSLYAYLSDHPAVLPSFRKEVYYFDMNYRRGVGYYRANFPTVFERSRIQKANDGKFLTGEATPCYMFHPHVGKRVLDLVPHAKLIVLLRNPIDRAYSYYSMNARRGVERESFEEATEGEAARLDGELEKMMADESYFSLKRQHYSYLSRGHYAEQIERWMQLFPREQFLILDFADLKRERDKTVNEAVEFLGLPAFQVPDSGRHNYAPYEKMKPETRQRLVDYYKPHNERLYDLLGRRFDWDR